MSRHTHHLYTLGIDERRSGIGRDHFLETMTAARIGVGVHYPSVAEHPVYRACFGWLPRNGQSPGSRADRPSVRIGPQLTDEDVERVVRTVQAALRCV